jgi:hypothetical protein
MKNDPISKKEVVYKMPGTDSVRLRHDVKYQTKGNETLTLDLYYPPNSTTGILPAVLIVAGFPDSGFEKHAGCKFKEMGSSVSWAKLIAASGMIAITYVNRDPEADVHILFQHIKQNSETLQLDPNSLGLWASSGNVPLALSILMKAEVFVRCAVLCYGYMLDLNGNQQVSDASKMFGFVNPNIGKSPEDLPHNIPLFIARAGQDQCPYLNETLDPFVARAIDCNLSITFVNHPEAPHAFDLTDDSKRSHHIVRQILTFLRDHLISD